MAVDAEEVALEVIRPARELTLPGGNVRQLTVEPPRPSVNMSPSREHVLRAFSAPVLRFSIFRVDLSVECPL